jgi:hypothetical protein
MFARELILDTDRRIGKVAATRRGSETRPKKWWPGISGEPTDTAFSGKRRLTQQICSQLHPEVGGQLPLQPASPECAPATVVSHGGE